MSKKRFLFHKTDSPKNMEHEKKTPKKSERQKIKLHGKCWCSKKKSEKFPKCVNVNVLKKIKRWRSEKGCFVKKLKNYPKKISENGNIENRSFKETPIKSYLRRKDYQRRKPIKKSCLQANKTHGKVIPKTFKKCLLKRSSKKTHYSR